MKDFESVLTKVPYNDIFDNPEYRKQLYQEYKAVTIKDFDASLQSYLKQKLSPEEQKMYEDENREPKNGYYFQAAIEKKMTDLAKEFKELDPIPQEYAVKDIKQTPTYKSLAGIQSLLLKYQDLALHDIDASDKADKYMTNIKDMMEHFTNSFKLDLIDRILNTDNYNTAIFFHKKFNPQDNPYEYKKRWEQLKISLNARLIEYKTELLEDIQNPTIIYDGLAKGLNQYVETTDKVISYIIQNQELPSNNTKQLWKNTFASAIIFCDMTGLAVSQWNKCFRFKNNRILKDSHRSKSNGDGGTYKVPEIQKIFEKYLK
ncbi:MAG: hypothetical protein VB024_11635 [Dysgonamonadaceae bacterium]|nr:hypothetical protein [Dysgonamonadaceae bacterium]